MDYDDSNYHGDCKPPKCRGAEKEMSGCTEYRFIDKYHDAKHQHGLPVGASWLALVMPLCHFSQPEQVVEEIIAPLSFLLLIVPFLHSKYIAWVMFDSAPLIQSVCY
ncbi:hypothetical protein [Phocaeicola vulgatus]|nr:hypothetical protein [Phocaeicola vulgatus]MDB1064278.1 hypothetical protein [Phocaeicola vulgatus]